MDWLEYDFSLPWRHMNRTHLMRDTPASSLSKDGKMTSFGDRLENYEPCSIGQKFFEGGVHQSWKSFKGHDVDYTPRVR